MDERNNVATVNAAEESKEGAEELNDKFRKILGSCNINFLFGAGVNGGALPCFDGFAKTIQVMKDGGLDTSHGIEMGLADCNDEAVREAAIESFVSEFNSKKGYDLGSVPLANLRRLLTATNSAVSRAENRHPESKRINIFTLNYDRIVEELLEECGFFGYTLTSESSAHLPFDVVGYNTTTRTFIPTFAVYKLHGSVDANRDLHAEGILFPGPDKLGSIVSHFYETLFSMKGELLRKNSVLFIIGYSWKDHHVNDVIQSGIKNGLTVVFPKYQEGDHIPEEFGNSPIVLPPADPNKKCDTTKTLAEYFERTMR